MRPDAGRPADAVFGPGGSAWPPGHPPPAGEGPRTALPIHRGVPRHLEAHLARLRAGAEALGQEVPWLAGATVELGSWLALEPISESALRLVLHLELRLLAARLEALPSTPDPYRLAPLPHPMGDLRSNPLAPHKGLSGPWRPPAMAEAHHRGAEDALLLWPDGTLAETAIAAVALERGGTLILPPAPGRVASVAERLDLPAWAEARGLALETRDIPLGIEGRLWCLNALRGIWPASLL